MHPPYGSLPPLPPPPPPHTHTHTTYTHTAIDIHKVDAVQRRAARWATRVYSWSSTAMMKDLNWRLLEQSRIDSHLVMMYKILFVCLFDLGLTSLSTIFQSYRDGVWIWQGAQCSLLECCLTEISCPRHFDMIFHPVTLYWHWADQFQCWADQFSMLSAKRKSS